MNRNQIIKELRQYFDVKELVCNHIYAKWGEASWQFLDTNYLHCLLIIRRDILQAPMTCNHTTAKQRGMRCNKCALVQEKSSVYVSSHLLGKAGDFSVKGMDAEKARRRIAFYAATLLPCPIRMEADVSWLHFDVLPQWGIDTKVHEFKE